MSLDLILLSGMLPIFQNLSYKLHKKRLSDVLAAYRKTPSKRTGCNTKINSPAADRTGAFTRAGGAKLKKTQCVMQGCGGADVKKTKEFFGQM